MKNKIRVLMKLDAIFTVVWILLAVYSIYKHDIHMAILEGFIALLHINMYLLQKEYLTGPLYSYLLNLTKGERYLVEIFFLNIFINIKNEGNPSKALRDIADKLEENGSDINAVIKKDVDST